VSEGQGIKVHSFRASRAFRVRLGVGVGTECDVYAARGSAGYDDTGPGILRRSAAVVIVGTIDANRT